MTSILFAFLPNPGQSSFFFLLKVVVGILLSIGSPILAKDLVKRVNENHAIENWMEGKATIITCKVLTSRSDGGPRYSVQIEYSFDVAGQADKGSRISLSGPNYRAVTEANAVARKYAVGTEHSVFFDAANPQNCVLERATGWGQYLMFLIPLLLFVVGLFVAGLNGNALWRRITGRPIIDEPDVVSRRQDS